MGFLRNIKMSIDDESSISVNGVALLTSVFIGFLIGLCVCFVLIYDVITNGFVKTSLDDLGIFLLCSGGYIAGSGIPKTVIDSRIQSKSKMAGDRMEWEEKQRRDRAEWEEQRRREKEMKEDIMSDNNDR